MKYAFLILAFTFLSNICRASEKDPVLKIILTNGVITKVVIDDAEQNINLGKVFFTDSISTGFHIIKVYSKKSENSKCNGKLIFEKAIGIMKGHNTLILIKDKSVSKISNIVIPGYKFNDEIEGGTYDETRSQPINGRAFANLKSLIKETSAINEKDAIIKDAIKNNFFVTSQIINLLDLVSEDRKLSFAKLFYAITLDKENYSEIIKYLKNEKDKKDLRRFVETY